METKLQVSCVIPFYNEGERLILVLNEVVKIKNVREIICVDDASEEDQSQLIQARFPSVQLIRLSKNQGKAGAVRTGVHAAQGDFILLIDADLQNLKYKEIERAIVALQQHPEVDLLILRRINANFYVKLNRSDTLFTGERILRKSDLEKVLAADVRGWQLEAAINTYMLEHNKTAYWMPQSAINTQKTSKWGFFIGIRNNLKTHADMMFSTGFFNFLKQYFFFAKEELKLETQRQAIPATQALPITK